MIYNLKKQIEQIEDIKQRLAALESAIGGRPEPATPKPHRLTYNHVGMLVEAWNGSNGEFGRTVGLLKGIAPRSVARGSYVVGYNEDGNDFYCHARLVTGIAPDEFTAAGTVLKFVANPIELHDRRFGCCTEIQGYAIDTACRGFWMNEYVIADEQPHLEGGE